MLRKILILLLFLFVPSVCISAKISSRDTIPAMADGDIIGIIDISDTTESVNGTGKKTTNSQVKDYVSDSGLDDVQMTPVTAPGHSEGLIFYDNDTKSLTVYTDEADFTWQLGREVTLRVYNDTGVEIADGKVCYLSGEFSGTPTVDLANASSAGTSLATLGFATHTIENGTYGEIVRLGTIHDFATSGFTSGDPLFLDTSDGDVTNVPPTSPDYLITLGSAGIIHVDDGTVEVGINIGTNTSGVIRIFNGAVLEDTATTTSSNGATVTLTYEQAGGGDLSLFFNSAFTPFDATPSATIDLTAGSDEAPTLNYIYIPESTMVLTKSTSGFPTTQHVPVATVLVQSAASAQTDDVYKLHAWTDHLAGTNKQGHLSDVNAWIRDQNAKWKSGVNPTTSVTTNGGAIDNVHFAVTSGTVKQLHLQPFPAIDMSTSAPIFAINDSTTANRRSTDLSDFDLDSLGATLRSNNTYYSIVILGVASEGGIASKLFCNLPSGSYISEEGALDDISKHSNYSIPTEYQGAGFFIARVTLRYQTADSGTITVVATENLRGLVPSTAAGGGGTSSGAEFSDNLFRVQAVSDITKKIAFDASAITTGNTHIVSMPDAPVDLADVNSAIQPINSPQANDIARFTGTDTLEGLTYAELITIIEALAWDFTSASSVSMGTLVFADGVTLPSTVGELRYVNNATGFIDGLFGWYDDDAVRYLMDVPTLPTVGSVLGYNPSTDENEFIFNGEVETNSKAAAYTIGTDDPNEMFGGIIEVTSAAVITAAAVAPKQNFTVYTIGDIEVSLDVNASDKIRLDGVLLDDGDKATNTSKSGDAITCWYSSADGFTCISGTVLGGHWNDGS